MGARKPIKITAEDVLAFCLALALHVLVAAFMWFGVPSLFKPEPVQVVPIKAVFLDNQRQQQLTAEAARLQAQAQAKALAKQKAEELAQKLKQEKAREQEQAKLKQEQLEAQRKAEQAAQKKIADEKAAAAELAQKKAAQEKAAQEKAAQEKAVQQKAAQEKIAQEKAAQEKAAKEKLAQEKARQEAERKRRQEESEKRMRDALAAEEAGIKADQKAAQQAGQDASDREIYAAQLTQHIQRHWSRPAGVGDDFSCEIQINQLPGGQIQSFKLTRSCGNNFLDASVESAINKSDPLPLPANRRVFERTLNLTFKP